MKGISVLLLAAATLGAAPAATAQDLTGTWSLTATLATGVDSPPCSYSGTGIQLVQTGDQVSGTVKLSLVSGGRDCPGEMTASLSGTVKDGTLSGTLDGSNNPGTDLGTATVTGTINPAAPAAAPMPQSASGSMAGGSGPFASGSGTWNATQQAPAPALAPLAAAALALLLLGGSVYLLTRRRAV